MTRDVRARVEIHSDVLRADTSDTHRVSSCATLHRVPITSILLCHLQTLFAAKSTQDYIKEADIGVSNKWQLSVRVLPPSAPNGVV